MNVIKEVFDFTIRESPDPRSNKWPLVESPVPILVIIFSYLYFVLRCGPRFMEKREPFELKTFIKFYNLFQIVSNSAIVYYAIRYGFLTDIQLGCEPINLSPEGQPMKLAVIFWWVFLLKTLDFVETVIFVLRKKTRQVSFLHLYHHVSTSFFAWVVAKVFPGGMMTFPLVVNSTIHVIMYTYYLASSSGPAVQRMVGPYKQYLTLMQMVQFVILFIHALQGLFPSCKVPKWGAKIMVINLLANFILFFNFYRKNYMKHKTA